MAYDSARGVTVLFGGLLAGGQQSIGDTWEWNGSNWLQREVSGPAPRHAHAMAFDSSRNVITLVGGRGHVAFRERDTLLLQGQTLRIAVDPNAHALVLTGAMLDLSRGRETRLYRRIERERGVLPP